jgi:hypothetical protein
VARPIRTAESSHRSGAADRASGELPFRRDGHGRVFTVWAFTDDEREAIAAGANIEVRVNVSPAPPPMAIKITDAKEAEG